MLTTDLGFIQQSISLPKTLVVRALFISTVSAFAQFIIPGAMKKSMLTFKSAHH
jgi:hypothetical protein